MPLVALLLAVFFLVFGTNLQGVLLPLLGHARGASMLAIGLYSSAWSAGFVIACACVGQLIGRAGHAKSFILLTLLYMPATGLLFLFPDDRSWIALRIVTGFCFGSLAALIEGWLIEQAGSGAAFAVYMIINLVASLLGTLSLGFVAVSHGAPLLLAMLAIGLAAVPVAIGRIPRPASQAAFRPRLLVLLRRSPVAAFGCVAAGLITGVIGGLAPVFGMMSSLSMRGDTLMMAANSVGGAAAYLPLSLLAERLHRRTMLIAASLTGLAVCVPLVSAQHLSPLALILLLGAFGFAQYPLYGICVGIANSYSHDRPASEIANEMVLLFGLGTIAGPLAGAQALREGPGGLFGLIAIVLAILLVVAWRMPGEDMPPAR